MADRARIGLVVVRRWWLPILASIATVGVAALAPFVVISYNRTGDQAQAGADARKTQCLRNPVSQKLAKAAYAVRFQLPPNARVTREELRDFEATAPKGCAEVLGQK